MASRAMAVLAQARKAVPSLPRREFSTVVSEMTTFVEDAPPTAHLAGTIHGVGRKVLFESHPKPDL